MTEASQGTELAGSILAWSVVLGLSISILSASAWFASVMWITAKDLLRNHDDH